jgi:hypothetical protein
MHEKEYVSSRVQPAPWKPRTFGLKSLSVSSEFNAGEGACGLESATSTVEAPDFMPGSEVFKPREKRIK